jgi:distribution and morphology protein 10
VSYLYSSLPLRKEFKSSHIDLKNVIRGYKHVKELRRPDENWWWELWHSGKRVDRKSESFAIPAGAQRSHRQIH